MDLRHFAQIACLAIVVSGCASHQPIQEPDAAPVSKQNKPVTSAGAMVATRMFHLRSAPSVNAKVVSSFRKGEMLDALIKPYDEIWNIVEIHNGPGGFIFGMPLHPAY